MMLPAGHAYAFDFNEFLRAQCGAALAGHTGEPLEATCALRPAPDGHSAELVLASWRRAGTCLAPVRLHVSCVDRIEPRALDGTRAVAGQIVTALRRMYFAHSAYWSSRLWC